MGDDSSPRNELVRSVFEKASNAAFGNRLITNINRGLVAEAIVALALGPDWQWVSADYSSWDFERADGIKLEVKQSAALQSWSKAFHGANVESKASFDIAPRTGYWQNQKWVPEVGRAAQIYVFCRHLIYDETADHRDPYQWEFYVVQASRLPIQKTISLKPLKVLCTAISFEAVHSEVQTLASLISS
ncbi:MAG: hypothetical protein ACOVN5_07630 [Aquidulcibacter sp.]